MATIAPIHPGEVLLEDFLEPCGVTQHRLAVSIGVPPRRINEIVHGKRRITADTGLRLSRFFGTTDSAGRTADLRIALSARFERGGPRRSPAVPSSGAPRRPRTP